MRALRLFVPLVATTLALLVTGTVAHAQGIRASLDRDQIAANETVTLRVQIQGSFSGQPSGPDGNDFRVVGQSMSTSVQIINRQRTTATDLTLLLRPTRTGSLTIGPVQVRTPNGVQQTQPFQVEVTDAQRAPSAATPTAPRAAPQPVRPTRTGRAAPQPLGRDGMAPPPAPGSNAMFSAPLPDVTRNEPFLLTQSTHDRALVGEQVIVDYLLFQPRLMIGMQFSDLSEPEFGSVWFSDITDARTRGRGRIGQVTVGNQRYDVTVVRSFTIVPLEPGELNVPSVTLQSNVRSRRGTTPTQLLQSPPLLIEVDGPDEAEAPPAFAASNVGAFTFQAAADRLTVRAGDTVTLTMSARGSALMSRIELPDVPDVDGARWFEPSDEQTAEVGRDGWLRGSASRRVSFVPLEEGTLEIPPITFSWYDPWREQFDSTTTDPITITVAGTNERAITLDEVDETTEWTEALPLARPLSPTPPPRPARAGGVLFALATFAPPAALAGWWTLLAMRRRREVLAPTRRTQRAAADARTAIDEASGGDAEVAAAIAAALRDYTGRCADQTISGAGLARLAQVATSTFNEAVGAQLRAIVERAERARYGGGVSVDELRADARTWIDAAEEVR